MQPSTSGAPATLRADDTTGAGHRSHMAGRRGTTVRPMTSPQPDQTNERSPEPILEPELPICDAHHHLWLDEGHTGWPYRLDDLHRDTGSGHKVTATVFDADLQQLAPLMPLAGSGTRFAPVWVVDVAAAVVRSIELPKTIGQRPRCGA